MVVSVAWCQVLCDLCSISGVQNVLWSACVVVAAVAAIGRVLLLVSVLKRGRLWPWPLTFPTVTPARSSQFLLLLLSNTSL